MKATGIVRRIDELGRVVIPKEIRRTLHIREGAPLEIYTESDGRVIFKKFSPVDEFVAVAEQYADVVSAALKMTVAICDRDRFVAVKGNRREVQDAAVSAALDDLLHGKKS
ncbi:MAG: stage V sporulation T C-terminal domain-containing protein, partial [Oscillospiraceae bacterium]